MDPVSIALVVLIVGYPIGLFLFKSWISAQIQNSVRHGFNIDLESFKSELESQREGINSLRSSIIQRENIRDNTLYTRKIEALEHVWAQVVRFRSLRAVSGMISMTNFERVAELANEDSRVREMFQSLNKSFGLEEINNTSDGHSEIYVSKVVWSKYNALKMMLMSAVIKAKFLEHSVDKPQDLFSFDALSDMVKEALPNMAHIVDEFGEASYFHLLKYLEEEILREIRSEINEEDQDEDKVQRAMRLQQKVDLVAKENYEAQSEISQ